MGKTALLAASAALVASTALADVIGPNEVVFEDGAVATSLTGVAGDPAEGRKIMNRGAGNCVACHAVTDLADLPFHGDVGPSLDGVADRWSEAELRGIVSNAKVMFEGTVMPSFYRTEGFTRPGDAFTGKAPSGPLEPLLTAQQVEDVLAYLMTLKDS